MNNKPCLDCPDRYPGCSSKCQKEDYIAWRSRKQRISEAIAAEHKREQLVLGNRRKGVKKTGG